MGNSWWPDHHGAARLGRHCLLVVRRVTGHPYRLPPTDLGAEGLVAMKPLGAETDRLTQSLEVLIVEDHVLLAQTLSLALLESGIRAHVLTDISREVFAAALSSHRPRVVVLDLDLGPTAPSGIELIPHAVDSGAAVLMVTGVRDRHDLGACLEAGASGVATKNEPIPAIVEKIRRAADGEPAMPISDREQLLAELRHRRAVQARRMEPFETLTPREREVLVALCAGSSPATIATEGFVSLTTVRGHINAILRKLGVSSQLAATAMARHAGWMPRLDADSEPPTARRPAELV